MNAYILTLRGTPQEGLMTLQWMAFFGYTTENVVFGMIEKNVQKEFFLAGYVPHVVHFVSEMIDRNERDTTNDKQADLGKVSKNLF